MKYLYQLFLFIFLIQNVNAQNKQMNLQEAEGLANLAIHCIHTEFPNKTGHVMSDSSQVKGPKELHPAFYGCFDWHSSVHGHWMLVKVLKTYPNTNLNDQIRDLISKNINQINIEKEVNYFNGKFQLNYERTYGWAWLFQLQSELLSWDDKQGKSWAESLEPLVKLLRDRMIDYLPKLTYPIRTGVHPNTAFALGFAYDYAISIGDLEFAQAIKKRGLKYFISDVNYPAYLEPNGTDFFSPSLLEADLMSRLLDKKEFAIWLDKFMPEVATNLKSTAIVSDRNDLQIVHLDGLNLSRSWCMKRIAGALDDQNPKKKIFEDASNLHLNEGLKSVNSGDYAGEHWLASFAIYALSTK